MFIDALTDFYERNPGLVLPAYHKKRETDYLLEIDADGGFSDDGDSITTSELPVVSPDSGRTSNPLAQLVFDKASYVLGIHPDEEKGKERLKLYRERVSAAADEIQSEPLEALLQFLENEKAVEKAANKAKEAGATKDSWIAPLVDDEWLVAKASDKKLSPLKQALQEKWLRTMSAEYLVGVGECLTCGESKPILRLHGKVSGFGSPDKSFANMNEDAFESHSLEKTTNAPMCLDCASKYVQALEYLSNSERHQLVTRTVRDDNGRIQELSKWLAWLREDTPDWDFSSIKHESKPEDALNALHSVWRSRPPDVDFVQFHAASLTMSDNRLSLRSFLTLEVEAVMEQIKKYFKRQKLLRRGEEQTYSLLSLLDAAAPLVKNQNTGRREPDRERLPPRFVDALVEHVLTGRALPNALRDRALRRCRAEQATEREGVEDGRRIDFAVPVHRAALLKLFLSQPDGPMPDAKKPTEKLDREHPDPAYHCGRYLAVADDVYYATSDGNSKNYVSKRYYTSLSTTPASAVGRIISNVQHQLDKLRRTRGGRATNLDRKITQIMGRIGDFPKTLRPNEQALFALGFYHQRDHIMTSSDNGEDDDSEGDSENDSA